MKKNNVYYSISNNVFQEEIDNLAKQFSFTSTDSLKKIIGAPSNKCSQTSKYCNVLDELKSYIEQSEISSKTQLDSIYIKYIQEETAKRLKYFYTHKIKQEETYDLLANLALQTVSTNVESSTASTTITTNTQLYLAFFLLKKGSIWLKQFCTEDFSLLSFIIRWDRDSYFAFFSKTMDIKKAALKGVPLLF